MRLLSNFAEEVGLTEMGRLREAGVYLRRRNWFMASVPLAAFYFGRVASGQYVAHSRIVAKWPARRGAQGLMLANVIQIPGLLRRRLV